MRSINYVSAYPWICQRCYLGSSQCRCLPIEMAFYLCATCDRVYSYPAKWDPHYLFCHACIQRLYSTPNQKEPDQ